jgi:hypothetical protein
MADEPGEEIRKEAIREARQEFSYASDESSGGSGKKYAFVTGAVLVLVGGIFAVSSLFHGATVTVTPRTFAADIKNDLTANKSSAAAGLSFQPKIIKQVGSVQLKATGEKQVKTQASGTIVIYNNYGTAPQRLVKNTRFETPEGLIYRINDSVTVPGKKGSVPGSVEATIVADEAGDTYNVGLKDFTIPGFKGDPRYSAFYAKSKPSSPLAGGFAGTVKIVAEADMVKAQADIKTKATVELLKQADSQVPEGSLFFSGAQKITCAPQPQENVSATEVLVKMECTLLAAYFDKASLSSQLARLKVSGYQNEPVTVKDLPSLTLMPRDGFDPMAETITFTLQGKADFEWVYDENTLKQKLSSSDSSQVASIVKEFPTIEKVQVSIRPFWRKSFPSTPADITIKKAL